MGAPNQNVFIETTESTTPLLTDPIGPVPPGKRIFTIDVLRGLALFGILAANFRGFAGPAALYTNPVELWPSMTDRLAQAFVDVFVQGKFITIFALLFGVGFAMQLERARARGSVFLGLHLRRLIVLALFGLAHGLLIWWGDILLPYALAGLVLLFFRGREDRTLLSWAIPLYLVLLGLIVLTGVIPILTGQPAHARRLSEDRLEHLVEAYSGSDIEALQTARTTEAVSENWSYFPINIMQILALFLAGMLVHRHRLLQPAAESLDRYRAVMFAALGLGIAGNLFAVLVRWPVRHPFSAELQLAASVVRFVSIPILSTGYICAVILICHSPVWRDRVVAGAAIGRTALTNYVLQSVIGTLIFYGYGLGLYGGLGPDWFLGLAIVIFGAQAWLSVWWLERFRFGPLEWIWRSLTYGRLQPMRR